MLRCVMMLFQIWAMGFLLNMLKILTWSLLRSSIIEMSILRALSFFQFLLTKTDRWPVWDLAHLGRCHPKSHGRPAARPEPKTFAIIEKSCFKKSMNFTMCFGLRAQETLFTTTYCRDPSALHNLLSLTQQQQQQQQAQILKWYSLYCKLFR